MYLRRSTGLGKRAVDHKLEGEESQIMVKSIKETTVVVMSIVVGSERSSERSWWDRDETQATSQAEETDSSAVEKATQSIRVP